MKLSTLSRTKVCAAISVAFCTLPAFAQVEAKLTGRIHYDVRAISNGLTGSTDRDTASVADNFEMRRARIGFQGSFNKQIQFEGVANAVGGTTNIIDTAFINYGYNPQGQIRVGRFKQPFSLEENTSSNNIDFMERSYVNQMVPAKKLGAMIHGATDNGFTYGASLYQNDFSEVSNSSSVGAMGALRATVNLAKLANFGGDDTVVHLGAGYVKGSYQVTPTTSGNTADDPSKTTRATILSFRDENRGLSNAYRLQIGGDRISTAAYGASADNVATIEQTMPGFEIAVAQGPFKIQGEYANSKFDATATKCAWAVKVCTSNGTATLNAQATAKYISALWNITGENFASTYSKGAWGGIKPSTEFMKDYGGVVGNGIGAWQLAYRYSEYAVSVNQTATYVAGTTNSPEYTLADGSSANVNSRYQNSPKATTNTFGLNWILSSNARVMFDYSETKFGSAVKTLDTNNNSSTTTTEKIFSVRTQVAF